MAYSCQDRWTFTSQMVERFRWTWTWWSTSTSQGTGLVKKSCPVKLRHTKVSGTLSVTLGPVAWRLEIDWWPQISGNHSTSRFNNNWGICIVLQYPASQLQSTTTYIHRKVLAFLQSYFLTNAFPTIHSFNIHLGSN